MEKTGLVLEGGAFRGIFTAGVLDYLLSQNTTFPYVVGVSAGCGNAANFIAGQHGRTKRVIQHENADSYFGISHLHRGGSILNLNTLVRDYSYEQIPFDFKAFFASSVQSEFVVTNCATGCAEYLSPNGTENNLIELTKAACSVPLVCKPVEIDGKPYLDGSIIDSIPYVRAWDKGCKKVFVILTRPEGEAPTDYTKMKFLVDVCYRHRYPALADALIERWHRYESQMRGLLAAVKKGRAFVIRPTMASIGHFENDREKMNEYYRNGYEIMKRNYDRLAAFME